MFEPTIKHVDPMTVAFLAMRGPYAQMPQAMGRLYEWVASQGWEPVGMPMGVYLTGPAEVPEDEAVWEVWAPVANAADADIDEAGFGVKIVPAGMVASAVHKGPYEQVGLVYEKLFAWTSEQGYAPAGPPREAYLNDPNEVGLSEALTEVQFPVAPVM